MAHTMAYLAVEPSLGALAVLRRQVEDAAEAGFQEAVLLLQKQPRSAAGTKKSSLEPARRRQTQGLENWADPVTGAFSISPGADIGLWGDNPVPPSALMSAPLSAPGLLLGSGDAELGLGSTSWRRWSA